MSEPTPSRGLVAYQGERGAFSEEAALRLLPGLDAATLRPQPSFEALFAQVSEGHVDFGVVPIENSLAGSIHRNYDLLVESRLKIIGETALRIVHCLAGPPGARLESIKRVLSHPVALAQCRRFFAAHPELAAEAAHDTAGALRRVIEEKLPQAAAIGPRRAVEVYSAELLAEGIEDDPENYTRFLLVARQPRPAEEGPHKTSVVFSMPNKPGILFRALAVFALRDLDLSKIESRPIQGRPWEYLFYVDFVSDAVAEHDNRARRALAHLGEMTDYLEVLGSYPRQV